MSKDLKKLEDSLHGLAVRLCQGGVVEFEGHFLRANALPEDFDPCDYCDMDCLCHQSMASLCCECDNYDHRNHRLKLVANPK